MEVSPATGSSRQNKQLAWYREDHFPRKKIKIPTVEGLAGATATLEGSGECPNPETKQTVPLVFQGTAKTGSFLILLLVGKGKSAKGNCFVRVLEDQGTSGPKFFLSHLESELVLRWAEIGEGVQKPQPQRRLPGRGLPVSQFQNEVGEVQPLEAKGQYGRRLLSETVAKRQNSTGNPWALVAFWKSNICKETHGSGLRLGRAATSAVSFHKPPFAEKK